MTPKAPLMCFIDVVIVTHKTRDLTLACIASLRSFPNIRFIVVDTGSQDGVIQAVTQLDHTICTLELDAETGYAAAANAGAALGTSPYLFICNADIVFNPEAVQHLLTALADERYGLVAPKLVNQDGTLQCNWARFPSLRTELTGALDRSEYNGTSPGNIPVSWVGGACIALRRTAWTKIKGYNPDIMFYGEDLDLCWRLQQGQLGAVVLVTAATIVHLGGQSSLSRSPLWLRRRLYKARMRDLNIVSGSLVSIPAKCVCTLRFFLWILLNLRGLDAHRT